MIPNYCWALVDFPVSEITALTVRKKNRNFHPEPNQASVLKAFALKSSQLQCNKKKNPFSTSISWPTPRRGSDSSAGRQWLAREQWYAYQQAGSAYREAVNQEGTSHSIISKAAKPGVLSSTADASELEDWELSSSRSSCLLGKFFNLSQISTALSIPKWGQKMEILLGWGPWVHNICAFALCTQKCLWFHPVAHRREMGSCPLLHNLLQKYKKND